MTFVEKRCIIVLQRRRFNVDISIFDLIAILYAAILEFKDVKPHNSISKEMSDALEKEAKDLVYSKISSEKKKFDTKMRVNSRAISDIIDICKAKNDYLFYRSVLCQLDMLIDIDAIVSERDFNKYDDKLAAKTFESLNSNHVDTRVVIIPKVSAPKDTLYIQKDGVTTDKEYKNSYYWYDNLNEHFENVICIPKDALKGYRINNVIIDFFKDRKQEKIIVGVTPLCNDSLNEIMDVYEYLDEQSGIQHFKVNAYRNPADLTEKFLQVLSLSKEKNVDILIGPEMLGTIDLCTPDELGYNKHFRDAKGLAPHLIVTPSLWMDGKNRIAVYSKTGELVGEQCKQNAFEFNDKGTRYEEDLRDIPKEILLIHVPGWGRISFLICVDFLVTDYRDLLVKELRSNLIFCPSYSPGTAQFLNSAGSMREFGVKFIWLNSCSALKDLVTSSTAVTVGTVAVPVMAPEDIAASLKPICPECGQKCRQPCLFTIAIQLRSNGDKHCNDVEIKHVPL